MTRPVTIFTGQWADLTFEQVCQMMSEIGYDGWKSPAGETIWIRNGRLKIQLMWKTA
jgi:hypothetical protein